MDNYIVGTTSNVEIPGINSLSQKDESNKQVGRSLSNKLKLINNGGNKRLISLSTIPLDKLKMLACYNYIQTSTGIVHTVYLDDLNSFIECELTASYEKVLESNGKYKLDIEIKEV